MDENEQLERQLRLTKQQLEYSGEFQRRMAELEQLRSGIDTSSSSIGQKDHAIKLIWQEGKDAPCGMSNSYCAAINGSTLYCVHATSHQVFTYDASISCWSPLPYSPTNFSSTVIINNLLTLVDGRDYRGALTDQLFSLTGGQEVDCGISTQAN